MFEVTISSGSMGYLKVGCLSKLMFIKNLQVKNRLVLDHVVAKLRCQCAYHFTLALFSNKYDNITLY